MVTVESGPFVAHKGKGLKVCHSHSAIEFESESKPSTRVIAKLFKKIISIVGAKQFGYLIRDSKTLR